MESWLNFAKGTLPRQWICLKRIPVDDMTAKALVIWVGNGERWISQQEAKSFNRVDRVASSASYGSM